MRHMNKTSLVLPSNHPKSVTLEQPFRKPNCLFVKNLLLTKRSIIYL